MRVCLVDQRVNLTNSKRGLLEAFARRFELSTVFVEDGWPRSIDEFADYESYDAIVWHVKFRYLMRQEPFDWGNYAGARIMFDLDALANYSAMGQMGPTHYLGRYPDVLRSNGFHVLVCTGKAVREWYAAEGIHAHWIAKGFDATRITNEMRPDRAGICYFGNRYAARRAMLARLDREHIPYTAFRCPPSELNDRLNSFIGCLICNQDLRGPRLLPSRIYRSDHFIRHAPRRWIRVAPGPEPMAKNFEVAAAGCAPICDNLAELADLGFDDGVSMISYESFDELVEKLRLCELNPEALTEIGRRAADLVRSRHSWDHRTEELERLIANREYLPS